MAAPSARTRVRAELSREIIEAARAELAVSGSAGLSLRAVARRMDMVPSALYRYYDGRDALLTALIIDAYRAVGATAAQADGAGGGPARRWVAVGLALRDWAWAHPSEWALVYGSPAPGYRAPADTIEPAMQLVSVLAGIIRTAHPVAGPRGQAAAGLPVTRSVSRELHRWIASIREPYLSGLTDDLAALAVVGYTQLLGGISVELFGHYGPEATPATAAFDHGLRVTAGLLGLT